MQFNIYISNSKVKNEYKKAFLDFQKKSKAFCSIKVKKLAEFKENKKEYTIRVSQAEKSFSSLELADKISSLSVNSISRFAIVFTDENIQCDYSISLSYFPFSNDLSIVLIAEQIYRIASILNNRNYHKWLELNL